MPVSKTQLNALYHQVNTDSIGGVNTNSTRILVKENDTDRLFVLKFGKGSNTALDHNQNLQHEIKTLSDLERKLGGKDGMRENNLLPMEVYGSWVCEGEASKKTYNAYLMQRCLCPLHEYHKYYKWDDPAETDFGVIEPFLLANFARQLAKALYSIHRKGLIHKDIKPGNILVEERNSGNHIHRYLMVIDFGISASSDCKNIDGLGTSSYKSPEMLTGNPPDIGAWVDIYAAGLVLYKLVTGKLPTKMQQELEPFRNDKPAKAGQQLILQTLDGWNDDDRQFLEDKLTSLLHYFYADDPRKATKIQTITELWLELFAGVFLLRYKQELKEITGNVRWDAKKLLEHSQKIVAASGCDSKCIYPKTVRIKQQESDLRGSEVARENKLSDKPENCPSISPDEGRKGGSGSKRNFILPVIGVAAILSIFVGTRYLTDDSTSQQDIARPEAPLDTGSSAPKEESRDDKDATVPVLTGKTKTAPESDSGFAAAAAREEAIEKQEEDSEIASETPLPVNPEARQSISQESAPEVTVKPVPPIVLEPSAKTVPESGQTLDQKTDLGNNPVFVPKKAPSAVKTGSAFFPKADLKTVSKTHMEPVSEVTPKAGSKPAPEPASALAPEATAKTRSDFIPKIDSKKKDEFIFTPKNTSKKTKKIPQFQPKKPLEKRGSSSSDFKQYPSLKIGSSPQYTQGSHLKFESCSTVVEELMTQIEV